MLESVLLALCVFLLLAPFFAAAMIFLGSVVLLAVTCLRMALAPERDEDAPTA